MRANRLLMGIVGGLGAVAVSPAMAQHFKELTIGRNAAGQLALGFDFGTPIHLAPSIFPGVQGYAFAHPGVHSLPFEEPEEDLFMLNPSCVIVMELVSADPGVQVWNDTGSAPMTPGQAYFIGTPVFDAHPLWNIHAGTAGGVYGIRLKVRDLMGFHAESDVFEPLFFADCQANCDGSSDPPALNVNDFVCFANRFAAGDMAANCDESTTPPVLNVNDFTCYLNRFAAGCP